MSRRRSEAVRCAPPHLISGEDSSDDMPESEDDVIKMKVGVHGVRGARSSMEDEHCVIPDLDDNVGLSTTFHPHWYFAVFDGHAGREAAEFARDRLHLSICENSHYVDNVQEAFKEGFLLTDKQIQENKITSGCTAVVAIVRGSKLAIGAAGDSRAVLSKNGQAVDLTRDHKPNREDEKIRIEEAGGFVQNGRVCGLLAVSRALGDFDWKKGEKHIVTAEPDVQEVEITPDTEFLILACDGVWDVLTSQDAVSAVKNFLDRSRGDPDYAVRSLIELALEKGTMDNVTAMVITFRRR